MPRRLTVMQREILKQLLTGKQNKQIAAELNLPEQTVKNASGASTPISGSLIFVNYYRSLIAPGRKPAV